MLSAFLLRLRGRRRWRGVASAEAALLRLALYLMAIVVSHVVAMIVLEDLPPFDAVWLTATTMVTVGYGDLAAKTLPGRLATMGLLYAGAIFVLAKAVNDWLDIKTEQAERKSRGAWRWNMGEHILIIGTPGGKPAAFFERLVRAIRDTPELADRPVQLLTAAFGDAALPRALTDMGVVHWHGAQHDAGALVASGAGEAHAVLVLARGVQDVAIVAETFDTIDRLARLPCPAPIVAECVDDNNRARLKRAGARSLVRPMPTYPGMLVRALVAPGSEAIIEDLFTTHGDECRRVDLGQPWRGAWTELATRLIGGALGTPIAYEDPRGAVHINPVGRDSVEASAVFVLMHEDAAEASARVRALLRG